MATLADDRNERRVDSGRTAAEQSDHRKRTLLRARRERPSRRAAEQRDELAPSHAEHGASFPPAGVLAGRWP